LFNGNGGEFSATIDRIERNATVIEVREHLLIERESPLVITLAQAVCAGEKMDWIIQKGVELGVSGIQVLATKLSRPNPRRASRGARCASSGRHIGMRAMRQEVFPTFFRWRLSGWVAMSEQKKSTSPTALNLRFILSPLKEGSGLFTRVLSVSSVTLLVGPCGRGRARRLAAVVFVPTTSGHVYFAPKPPVWQPLPLSRHAGEICDHYHATKGTVCGALYGYESVPHRAQTLKDVIET
jgi:16S rRNA (uracil1498-N3)-methyltransferase